MRVYKLINYLLNINNNLDISTTFRRKEIIYVSNIERS